MERTKNIGEMLPTCSTRAFYKDKYKDGLMDSESMMAMVAVEMARLYCEMVQDRKTLLADLRKLEAEAAKILDGHTGE
mgnify:CR=1 FL=1